MLAIGFVVGLSAGCGPRPISATTVSSSQAAWDRAVAAFESGDVATALESLNLALGSTGGLSGDLYVDALLMRAVCLAAERRSDEADADLELAAEGVTDPDQLCIARAAVCFSRGERKAAERQMTEALNWNPRAPETPLWKAAKTIATDGS